MIGCSDELSFTHGSLTQESKGKKRMVRLQGGMTTIPPEDPGRDRIKSARGSDSGTMPLSEALELDSFFTPAPSESVRQGGTADSLGLKI
jgi:hypothetical protein